MSYDMIQFINQEVVRHLPCNYVQHNDKLNMRCPLCGDSKKSKLKKRGWYYQSTASYYCFNCGTSMSGLKFLEYISGSDYEQIKRDYLRIKLNGRNINYSTINTKSQSGNILNFKSIVDVNWKKELTDTAKDYLRKRGVLDAPFLQEQLYSYIAKNEKEYIFIPWILNGVEAYYQVNDFLKHGSIKYLFPKDKQKLLYGLDNIDISFPYIFLVEGVYDSLFIKNAIATGSKSISDIQLKILKKRYPRHQLVVSFDNDLPGLISMKKLILGNNDFKFFKWFNPSIKQKDINDYVLHMNDVNIFADPLKLEKMICGKAIMKMYLVENGIWYLKERNDNSKIKK